MLDLTFKKDDQEIVCDEKLRPIKYINNNSKRNINFLYSVGNEEYLEYIVKCNETIRLNEKGEIINVTTNNKFTTYMVINSNIITAVTQYNDNTKIELITNIYDYTQKYIGSTKIIKENGRIINCQEFNCNPKAKKYKLKREIQILYEEFLKALDNGNIMAQKCKSGIIKI